MRFIYVAILLISVLVPSKVLAETFPRADTVTVIDLGAKACIPCKLMEPILATLKEEFTDRADVIFIDVWENPDAAQHYGIRIIPTQIFYNTDGEEVFRHEGFMAEEDIRLQLEEILEEN